MMTMNEYAIAAMWLRATENSVTVCPAHEFTGRWFAKWLLEKLIKPGIRATELHFSKRAGFVMSREPEFASMIEQFVIHDVQRRSVKVMLMDVFELSKQRTDELAVPGQAPIDMLIVGRRSDGSTMYAQVQLSLDGVATENWVSRVKQTFEFEVITPELRNSLMTILKEIADLDAVSEPTSDRVEAEALCLNYLEQVEAKLIETGHIINVTLEARTLDPDAPQVLTDAYTQAITGTSNETGQTEALPSEEA